MVMDGATAVGVFPMLPEDALIWGPEERGEHLYLHRITRAAATGSRGLLDVIPAGHAGVVRTRVAPAS